MDNDEGCSLDGKPPCWPSGFTVIRCLSLQFYLLFPTYKNSRLPNAFGNDSSSVYPKHIRMPVNLSSLIIFVQTHVHITWHRYSVHRLFKSFKFYEIRLMTTSISMFWLYRDHSCSFTARGQRCCILFTPDIYLIVVMCWSLCLIYGPFCLFLLCLISKQSIETVLAFCDGSRRPIWDAFLPANPT